MQDVQGSRLEIRLLGKLEIVRDDKPLALPRSKKARALLAYLIATERSHPRTHLCEMLWEGPADPRAALRWSLSKIRPLVNDEHATRLVTNRDRISFEPCGAEVDLYAVRTLIPAKAGDAPTEALQEAATQFRGAFLTGLDLSECYRFDVWCMAQREALHRLYDAILSTLVHRLKDRPEAALRYACDRLLIDPLSEAAHTDLMRLLGEMGRTSEALEQYESFREKLKKEFGRRPSPEMERVRRALTQTRVAPKPPAPSIPASEPSRLPSLVGRREELDTLHEFLTLTEAAHEAKVLLVVGEPGIGKTRLLEELVARVRRADGLVLAGRAFGVEMVRPYGAWIDALRTVSPDLIPTALHPELAPLLPELGTVADEEMDRNRLFDAVARLLVHLAAERRPVALVLDDLHWFDEASAALLHFVARNVSARGVMIACAARPAELEAHAAARRLVHSLQREDRLCRLALAPLNAGDTAELVRGVAPDLDAEHIFQESEGNPLFALEIARSLQTGGHVLSDTLEGLIQERLAGLDPQTREVIPWAAALGRSFDLDVLTRVSSLSSSELLHAVEELERLDILRATSPSSYDFTHNLIRQAAYQKLSGPRRRLVHLQIARSLAGNGEPEQSVAGEVAHHAALGGDHELAARACTIAGRHALRLYAYEEVAALARRGLDLLTDLPREKQLPLQVDLLGLYVHPGMDPYRPDDLESELRRLVAEARTAGLNAQVRNGLYLIGVLHYLRGDFGSALDVTLRAEQAGRMADPATVVRAIADTARCLGMLGREMDRAEKLAREAQMLAEEFEVEKTGCEIPMALGLVRHHAGELDEALRLFESALPRARRAENPWWEYYCLSRLPMIELERGCPSNALAWCRQLNPVAKKMGAGSEASVAEALEALARRALGEDGADEQIDEAIDALRALDSKWMLAYVQTFAAEFDLAAGRLQSARHRAEEALRAAEAVKRSSERALARVLLARLSIAEGDPETAAHHLDTLREDLASPHILSARARDAAREAARTIPA